MSEHERIGLKLECGDQGVDNRSEGVIAKTSIKVVVLTLLEDPIIQSSRTCIFLKTRLKC